MSEDNKHEVVATLTGNLLERARLVVNEQEQALSACRKAIAEIIDEHRQRTADLENYNKKLWEDIRQEHPQIVKDGDYSVDPVTGDIFNSRPLNVEHVCTDALDRVKPAEVQMKERQEKMQEAAKQTVGEMLEDIPEDVLEELDEFQRRAQQVQES